MKKKDMLMSLFLVTLGSLTFATGINMFAIPNELGEGGVTGITLLLYYTLGWSPAVMNLVINAFLLVIGYRFLDKITMVYTLLSIFIMSFGLQVTTFLHFKTDNSVVAAIATGVIAGAGVGMVILGHGTTAGSDIIAMLCKKYLGWSISPTLLALDVAVVVPLSLVIGIEKAILTILMLYVASKVITFILEGFNPRNSVMIISKKHKEIATRIQDETNRGLTILEGRGGYADDKKEVLYVVISRRQLMPVQRIINEIDPAAFVIITEVQQVVGEGFTFYLDESPNEEIRENS